MSFPGPAFYETGLHQDSLIARYWDDTLDGDCTDAEDVATFLEPFSFTEQLQSS